jgi:hypothetical protein
MSLFSFVIFNREKNSFNTNHSAWMGIVSTIFFFLSLLLLVPDAISLKTTWWCRETPEEKDKARERRNEEEKGIEEDGHMRVEKGLIQMHYGGEGLERGGG